MLDLRFRSVARASSATEKAFHPGDRVVSFLYQDADGVIDRWDVLESEVGDHPAPGPVFCRWRQDIREKEETGAEQRKQALQGAEAIFLGFFEEAGEGDSAAEELSEEAIETRKVLQFFLALQLERKRVLRNVEQGIYLHVKTKKHYPVPTVELGPETLLKLQPQIESLSL